MFLLKVYYCYLLIFCGITIGSGTETNLEMLHQFSEGTKKLYFDLMTFIEETTTKTTDLAPNIILSPFSIQIIIHMVRMAATGRTADEIDEYFKINPEFATNAFHNVLAFAQKNDLMKFANKIYVQLDYNIQNDYNDFLTKKFLTSVEKLDFKNSVEAANKINEFVENATNKKIQNLIAANSLNSDTRIILVNAIYFKGDWVYPFSPQATQNELFYINDIDTINVPMMNLKERLQYGIIEKLDATALELPYKNSDLALLIILPNKRTGLKSLQDKLKNTTIDGIKSFMSKHRVSVKLPKFKTELTVELNEPLQKLGIKRMFTNNAELDKMLDSNEGIKVSKIIHKAYIDVNEQGTEAAAATDVLIRRARSIGSIDEVEFIADHPFFYILSKNRSETSDGIYILFCGTYNGAHTIYEHDEL